MNALPAEKWLTTREAATALKISCRAVKKNAAKGKYTTKLEKTPNGQQGYLIALSSLPVAPAKSAAPAPAKVDIMTGCDDRQRAEAFRRLEILQQWKGYVERSDESASHATETYLRLGLNGEISRSTLYRWDRDYEAAGLLGLIPNWSNGKGAYDETRFCPEAKLRAKQLYLSTARPSCAAIYKQFLEKEAILKGWSLPSYSTVRRFLQAIRPATRILLREGKKAFNDRALPVIRRTLKGLRPMEIIESDHHQLDVAVIDRDGNVFFPWLTIWFDVRARRPLSWGLFSTPNSDGIRITLRKTIEEFGVPLAVHIDNGKDYRAKVFRGEQGRFKAEKTEFKNDLKPCLIDGIYGMLGIKVHWAIPYNAKTKVIERFFRTLRTEFSVWFRGYRGKNTIEKPEILAKQRSRGDVVKFDDLKLLLRQWIDVEYCQNRPHRGLENRTPNQVFAEKRIEKRTVRDEELLWLCSEHPRTLKVGRDGIYFMNDYYWSEKIAREYFGKNIKLRFIEDNPNRIFVMNEQGSFIGMAEKSNPGTWGQKSDEYRKFLRMQKAVRESTMPDVQIAKSLPPAEREKLFISLIKDDGTRLPAAPERRVTTPFGSILDEEKKARERAERQEAAGLEWLHQYADGDMKPEESASAKATRLADDFFRNYHSDRRNHD